MYRCLFKVDPETGIVIGNTVCPGLWGDYSYFLLLNENSLRVDNYGQVYATFQLHDGWAAAYSGTINTFNEDITYSLGGYSGFPLAMRLDFAVENEESVHKLY